jgi:hypothetical protein
MLSRVAFFTKELLTVNLFGEDSLTLSTSRASCKNQSNDVFQHCGKLITKALQHEDNYRNR